MATKKKSKKGNASRARRKVGKKKTTRRRSTAKKALVSNDMQSLAMAAIGAVGASAIKDSEMLVKLIPDAKMRYGVLAGLSLFVLPDMFPDMAPVAVGAGILSAANLAAEAFPQLLPAASGGTIGRLSPARIAQIRDAVAKHRMLMNGGDHVMAGRSGVMTGPGVMTGNPAVDTFTGY